MSIRSGVYWAIAGAIVLAGCASLVGAEEATLVQGRGGGAGSGGAAAGNAGAPACDDSQTPCKDGCKDLRNDPNNCGLCENVCSVPTCVEGKCQLPEPESFDACPPQKEVTDIAVTPDFLWVACSNGQIFRLKQEKPPAEEVNAGMPALTMRLGNAPDRVFAFVKTTQPTLFVWVDQPPDYPGLSSELPGIPVDQASLLAAGSPDSVFLTAADQLLEASAKGTYEALAQLPSSARSIAADPDYVYLVDQSFSAFAFFRTNRDLVSLTLPGNPSSVSARKGGALFVRKGKSADAGDIAFLSAANIAAPPETLVEGLTDPVEAYSTDTMDIYFVEDPTGQGRIGRWTQTTRVVSTLAEGQQGARAVRVAKNYVWWGMPSGEVRRTNR